MIMISHKRTTLALSTLAIAAVIALFASDPLIAAHQAVAFHGRSFHGGFGFHGWGWGGCGGGCGCGFGGCWANLW